MNRFEQDYYNDVSSIEKSLKRIADALENSNVQPNRERVNIDDLIKYQKEKHAEQIAHNVKHAFTGMDGKQVDEAVNETFKAEEQEETDIQHDYLHQLVQNLDNNG